MDLYNIKEIDISEEKSLEQFLLGLGLASAPVLVSVNGEIFCPETIKGKLLVKGDKLLIIPLSPGG